MKALPAPGTEAVTEFTVGPDMYPAFEGRVVHEVLGTAALVHQMEWAARKVLLPVLEPGEEGVGTHVSVRHLAPAFPGERVTVRARALEGATSRELVCQVEAFTDRTRIGEGTVGQAILPLARLKEMHTW